MYRILNNKIVQHQIGSRMKILRVNSGYTSYENFALDNSLSRMQYWRMEKGLSNLTIKSLLKILNIHQISIEDFFQMKVAE
jgi:transcriptional regulator with XRE-family HTH domain